MKTVITPIERIGWMAAITVLVCPAPDGMIPRWTPVVVGPRHPRRWADLAHGETLCGRLRLLEGKSPNPCQVGGRGLEGGGGGWTRVVGVLTEGAREGGGEGGFRWRGWLRR